MECFYDLFLEILDEVKIFSIYIRGLRLYMINCYLGSYFFILWFLDYYIIWEYRNVEF